MSNTQGVQDVTLPDNVKNALENAQNRLTLIKAETDQVKNLKISFEREVLSLAEDKNTLTAEKKALMDEIANFKNILAKIKEDEVSYGEKRDATRKEFKDAFDENEKMKTLVASKKATSDAFDKSNEEKKESSSKLDTAIADKKDRLAKFAELVHNLL